MIRKNRIFMKFAKRWLASVMLVVAFTLTAAGPVGCASRLEPGGAYALEGQAPDKAFYAVEASFDLATSVVHTAFEFERSNRLMLWRISPDIKHGLDKLRPVAKQVVKEYGVAREAYLANPTPAGLSTMKTVLGRLQQTASAAQAVLPKE